MRNVAASSRFLRKLPSAWARRESTPNDSPHRSRSRSFGKSLPRKIGTVGRRVWALPLEVRFVGFSLIVLVVGAIAIGWWVSHAIRDGVVDRTGEVAAQYVESFVAPELQGEPFTGPLSLSAVGRLDQLLETTALGDGIVSFKVWSRDGTIRYASDPTLIGEAFAAEHDVAKAFDGTVTTELSNLEEEENRYEAAHWDRLLETYTPIRSAATGDAIAVAEFYQLPDNLLAEVRSSQRTGWIIVGVATFGMFVLLNGLVRSASQTIRRQTRRLEELADRLRVVSAAKIETDEAIFRRVSQDLHDGPTQGLALAVLRMDSVEAALRGTVSAEDAALVAKAVEGSLADVRQISIDLRLPDLRQLTLHDILRRAVEQHTSRTGEQVALQGSDGTRVPSGPRATTIFRVVSEALNNAARHAGAGRRVVTFEQRGRSTHVAIEDDGVGFHPDQVDEGLGLKGMRERAEVLGGHLIVQSRPGNGTRVELVLPEDFE